jgi:hypothetical protein
VLDPSAYSSVSYSDGKSRIPFLGETLAHELIGHGLGGREMMSGDGKDEAIQLGNMYLKAVGESYFRPNHGAAPNDQFTNPRSIPAFLDPTLNPIDN